MVEKPAPGTGATLMVDVISIIATGAGASVMVEGRDEDEWRKRLTAKLREIPAIVLIDNLRRQLDASSVAAALTAPYWEDRVLGKSEMTRFPIRCVWIATGNNPQFSNEMARRMVRIRLDPHEDQPWLREGFRHPNLLAWVWQNRARLVAACLTLGRAWIAAGMPRHQKTIGSFEGWAEVMGGILEVAGVPGFLGNLKEMYEAADAEGSIWRGFVACGGTASAPRGQHRRPLRPRAAVRASRSRRATSTPSGPASARRSNACAIESSPWRSAVAGLAMPASRTARSAGSWRLGTGRRIVAVAFSGLFRVVEPRRPSGWPPEAHRRLTRKNLGKSMLWWAWWAWWAFFFLTHARARARERRPEKAHQAHQAHQAQEIRGLQAVGLRVGLETDVPPASNGGWEELI